MPIYSGDAPSEKYITGDDSREIARDEAKKIARIELEKESKELRKEFIAIFGLFAAFITFTVLQIQAFIQATEMSLIMGASAFFVGSSLTFVIALHDMINDRTGWKDALRPVYVFTIIMFAFSFACFFFSVQN